MPSVKSLDIEHILHEVERERRKTIISRLYERVFDDNGEEGISVDDIRLDIGTLGELIEHLPQKAIQFYEMAFRDENEEVRKSAAVTLWKLAERQSDVAPEFYERAFQDENNDVRRNAAQALGKLAEHRPDVAPEFYERAFQDEDEVVRIFAATELIELAEHRPDVAPKFYERAFQENGNAVEIIVYNLTLKLKMLAEHLSDVAPEFYEQIFEDYELVRLSDGLGTLVDVLLGDPFIPIKDKFYNLIVMYLDSRYVHQEEDEKQPFKKEEDIIGGLKENLSQDPDIDYDRLNRILRVEKARNLTEMVECSKLDIRGVNVTHKLTNDETFTSNVYMGFAKGSNAPVVIKVIRNTPNQSTPNMRRKFLNGYQHVMESNLFNQDILNGVLDIPNLIRQRDFDNSKKEYCWFVYYDAGQTLREYLDDNPDKITDLFLVSYFAHLTIILSYMHDNDIAHRDIKPDNVFVNENSGLLKAKIGDFDTPIYVETIEESRKHNPSFESIGSPLYMSPEGSRDYIAINSLPDGIEIPKGLQQVDWIKNDVYCVGCMLYESLTGKLPGQSEGGYWEDKSILIQNGLEEFYKIILNDIELSDLPDTLKSLISGCIAPEEERITMDQLNDGLKAYLREKSCEHS